MSQQDNIVQRACDEVFSNAASMTRSLAILEQYLDKVVEELSVSRSQLEGILQDNAGAIPDGMANQLWSRLGKFDRCIQMTYARQQSATEKVIELKAHISTLLSFHDQARAEEQAFAAACLQFADGVLEEAKKHVE